ncbi:hypothetical protein EVAR_82134_1 [Eumeta japonica]|uniref:Uncharacterized protein n=1 Tax=Eumeta variegata TaxID=151549 RepID=A0A4C1U1S7_EUMVA|nr:hypothetical protein EVAR_82134_1 [Eumeta japonica]
MGRPVANPPELNQRANGHLVATGPGAAGDSGGQRAGRVRFCPRVGPAGRYSVLMPELVTRHTTFCGTTSHGNDIEANGSAGIALYI